MAFRSREMMKKIVRKVGENNFAPGVKDSLKKCVPDTKVIMGRAKRGLFAGRHIQFGNRVSEDGGNKLRRSWKPNVQEKRLFSYIMDRHIRIKVTTHALRCIDKAGGIDEYLLNTPYHKMDTEMGLFWKSKIEKMYEELGEMEVSFYSPEDEARFEDRFKEMKATERDARRQSRRHIYGDSGKQKENRTELAPFSYILNFNDSKRTKKGRERSADIGGTDGSNLQHPGRVVANF